ncbi:glycosyltransferase family 2 protein [Winogradskyella aurantiaca]|uniref:glycosyltransferase family 2 protein n=1 Tax=Winogradskyella aurantiaca TaxID=2219558 RepID=UPI0013002930|nr:glycosyltransferase family 2 protein [Winogradskyella aurantiaca]
MSLAIIIPYYKPDFFEDTLNSILSQTDQRFSLYIGDDASRTAPVNLLDKLKFECPIRYKRFENNLGGKSLAQQWCRCIDMSIDEEWIMILCDDDTVSSNLVEEFYKNYHQFNEKANVIRFASKVLNMKTQELSQAYTHPIKENIFEFLERKTNGMRSSLSEYAFRRDSYLKYGFRDYPLAYHSDDMAWVQFSEEKPIYSINEAEVIFRLSDVNITGNSQLKRQKDVASQKYFSDLIRGYGSKLNKRTLIFYLMLYEKNIKQSRKLNNSEWLFLLRYYLRFFHKSPVSFLKFLRRFIINSQK